MKDCENCYEMLEENDPIMELIINSIRRDESKIRVINPIRFKEMIEAKKALDELLAKSYEDGQARIKYFPAFSSASISAKFDCFEVRDFGLFWRVVRNANNFEMVPLTDGSLSFAAVFNHIMIAVE